MTVLAVGETLALANVATYAESSSVTESPDTMSVNEYDEVASVAMFVVLYARVGTVIPRTVMGRAVTVDVRFVGATNEYRLA